MLKEFSRLYKIYILQPIQWINSDFDALFALYTQSFNGYHFTLENLRHPKKIREKVKMKLMITGGAGFIGSNYLRLTNIDFDKVTIIDSMEFGSQRRLLHAGNREFTLINKCLTKMSENEIFELIDQDTVVLHLAAQKLHNPGANSQKVIDHNISASRKVFSAAVRGKAKKIINASSLYVYNKSSLYQFSEASHPSPYTAYGASKYCSERLLEIETESTHTDPVNLRFFFVFGPYQFMGNGYPSVIVKSMKRILNGDPPLINGSGSQILDYIAINDVVTLIDSIVQKADSRGTFNVSTGDGISINDVVRKIIDVTKFSGNADFVAADWTDGTCRVGNNSLACKTFNWQPTVKFEDCLLSTWEWIKTE